MAKLTRRNFLAGSALAAAAAGLAACNQGAAPADGGEAEGGDAAPAADIFAAPDASAYPIEPDGEGVEALYETKESRAGQIIYTNPNGVEIGVSSSDRMIQVGGLAFRDANGDGMFSNEPVPEDQKYLPISLQYRPYTADTARDPSLAGDIVDGVKENRSYKGKSVTASNEGELDKLLELRAAMPDAKIILIVEGTNNAQCFHEIEPSADVILWSWASSGRAFGPAYGRILKGEVEPSALLPCQMPASMEAVEARLEDVPRDLEVYVDSEGNAYDFCFGLNWSGVIDDERTASYKAAPLTEPETEVIPGEWTKE